MLPLLLSLLLLTLFLVSSHKYLQFSLLTKKHGRVKLVLLMEKLVKLAVMK